MRGLRIALLGLLAGSASLAGAAQTPPPTPAAEKPAMEAMREEIRLKRSLPGPIQGNATVQSLLAEVTRATGVRLGADGRAGAVMLQATRSATTAIDLIGALAPLTGASWVRAGDGYLLVGTPAWGKLLTLSTDEATAGMAVVWKKLWRSLSPGQSRDLLRDGRLVLTAGSLKPPQRGYVQDMWFHLVSRTPGLAPAERLGDAEFLVELRRTRQTETVSLQASGWFTQQTLFSGPTAAISATAGEITPEEEKLAAKLHLTELPVHRRPAAPESRPSGPRPPGPYRDDPRFRAAAGTSGVQYAGANLLGEIGRVTGATLLASTGVPIRTVPAELIGRPATEWMAHLSTSLQATWIRLGDAYALQLPEALLEMAEPARTVQPTVKSRYYLRQLWTEMTVFQKRRLEQGEVITFQTLRQAPGLETYLAYLGAGAFLSQRLADPGGVLSGKELALRATIVRRRGRLMLLHTPGEGQPVLLEEIPL